MITKLNENVKLNCIQNPKFKDVAISINFLNQITNLKATTNTLLALMLTDRCAKYETKKKMNEVSDHLYGATLSARTLTYGNAHCLELRSRIINPMYVNESNALLSDWIQWLHEVICHPLMVHDIFSEDSFNEAKRLLKSKILRRNDDASSYSILKAFEIAGRNQSLSISSKGDLDVLEKLTIEEVTQSYFDMLAHDQIEIVVLGQIDEQQVTTLFKNTFDFNDRTTCVDPSYMVACHEFENQSEEKDLPQTNLTLVYATQTRVTDCEFAALKVANGILGQLPSSYLFQVVREQNSLCYSIFSNLISYDGALAIATGIDRQNVDKTLELIEEQVKRCQEGDFTEEMIQTTKQMLIHALQASLDEMNSIIGFALSNSLLKRQRSIDEQIQAIVEVSKEDIIEVFSKLHKQATFVLIGKGSSNE